MSIQVLTILKFFKTNTLIFHGKT